MLVGAEQHTESRGPRALFGTFLASIDEGTVVIGACIDEVQIPALLVLDHHPAESASKSMRFPPQVSF